MDTNALLDAGRFEDVLRTINSGATADMLEMANVYRKDFGGALSKTNFKLEDIACGEHLCAAIFKGTLNDENAFNDAVMAEGNRAKIYAIVQRTVAPVSSGEPTEYRMIFTTDPKYGGLVADYYPQTQAN